MTDYFSLLGQPRCAWLDADELKQAFHAKSRQAHPDAQQNGESHLAFAELNEGHQVLLDPKRRLHHLLTLAGKSPNAGASVPAEIEALFTAVAAVTQQATATAEKSRSATNPLSRSLIKPQLMQAEQRVAEMLQKLERLYDDATQRLRDVGGTAESTAENTVELQRLYLEFSYLTRWIAELRERQLQLSTAA